MPTIALATLVRAKGIRRPAITLRPITTTAAQANELAAIMLPIVNLWQAAQADILRGYVLPTMDANPANFDAKSLIMDGANDMQSAIDRAANEAARLVLVITPRLREWAIRLERWHKSRWAGAVFAATNIDLSSILTALPVQETLDAFISRNVALVKDVSAQAQGRLADIIFRNYQSRTPIAKVAKEMSEAVGLSRKRARRIASHQTANLSAALDRQRQTEAGIEKFQWRWSGKQNGRPEHIARDGNVYSWTDPPSDLPGELPACGCRAAAYLDIIGELQESQ